MGRYLRHLAGMEVEGRDWLTSEGIPSEGHRFDRVLEARYSGQNFEIAVPFAASEGADEMRKMFDEAHRREQGFSLPNRSVDSVTYRVKVHALSVGSQDIGEKTPMPDTTDSRSRPIWIAGDWHDADVLNRESLKPGTLIAGPAVLNEVTATTLIPPNWRGEVLDDGTISITPKPEGEG